MFFSNNDGFFNESKVETKISQQELEKTKLRQNASNLLETRMGYDIRMTVQCDFPAYEVVVRVLSFRDDQLPLGLTLGLHRLNVYMYTCSYTHIHINLWTVLMSYRKCIIENHINAIYVYIHIHMPVDINTNTNTYMYIHTRIRTCMHA